MIVYENRRLELKQSAGECCVNEMAVRRCEKCLYNATLEFQLLGLKDTACDNSFSEMKHTMCDTTQPLRFVGWAIANVGMETSRLAILATSFHS